MTTITFVVAFEVFILLVRNYTYEAMCRSIDPSDECKRYFMLNHYLALQNIISALNILNFTLSTL